MIESIIIKNKKGDKIELSLDELEELKGDLNKLESTQPHPYPTFWPTTSQTYPWYQGKVSCAGQNTNMSIKND